MITDGSRVSIEYTLTTADGTVADSNVGEDPLIYEQGQQEILPALERALLGLKVGDTTEVTLEPQEGYGTVDDELFETVPSHLVPENGRQVGAFLVAQAKTGERRQVRVAEVNGDEIVIDLNHPLAGQTLHFAVRILSIE